VIAPNHAKTGIHQTMKTILPQLFAAAFLIIPLLLGGCGGNKVSKDTTAFDKAFKSAPADVQAAAAKASTAFKGEKLLEASNALTEAAGKGALTQEQKDSMIDMIVKIQTIMSLNPDKSDMKVFQATENATAALEGRPAVAVGQRRD
jgi:hypothetical protein